MVGWVEWMEKENLGPACAISIVRDMRGWPVEQVSAGVFRWTSPTDRTYLPALEPYDHENDERSY
jgi:hypothetical protein